MSRHRTVAIALGLLAAACGDGTGPGTLDAAAGATPTYYRDIKPIIDAKCAGCHLDGGIAPFVLTDYERAAAHAGVAALAVAAGTMPPWLAAEGCNDYLADRSLDDEQRALIQRWAALGAPAGDPANVGPPLETEDPSLTRIDHTLEMPVSYTAANEPDDYRCFLIEWPATFTATKYITGYRVNPGNLRVAHHAIAFLATADQKPAYYELDAAEDGPGYTCFGGSRGPSQQWIASWAPGALGTRLPAGHGIAVPPGALIVLQMHYNSTALGPQPDRSSIDFQLEDSVDRVARIQPWANPAWVAGDMPIPAGDPDVSHSFAYDATVVNGGRPFLIHAAFLHMHNLGTSARLHIERNTGGTECLLDIPRWDFNWQGSYGLRDAVRFDPGDRMVLGCRWDNSATHQPIVDGQPLPPRDVNWGDGTSDEMCLGGWLMSQVE
jgi:hypothetical protein